MKYNINLLAHDKRQTLWDRVFYFVLNYLRYIIVLTQLVVIFTFFGKFATDQEIVDLQESIDQKTEIISLFQPLVKDAKAMSYKIDAIKEVTTEQQHSQSMLGYVLERFPEDLTLTKLEAGDDIITLRGITVNVNSIKAFVRRLQTEKKFHTVDLKSLNRTDGGIECLIELKLFKDK
jgi:Tfp pilus assembly protein PilN